MTTDTSIADALERTMARLPPATLLDWRDTAGQSLVHRAVACGHLEALETILQLHRRPDRDDPNEDDLSDLQTRTIAAMEAEDEHGKRPLTLAIETQRADCVQLLLAHGASWEHAHHDDHGDSLSPLHVAATYDTHGNELLGALLDVQPLEARDVCDNTPLHLAVAYGSEGVVRELLKAGSDVHAVNAAGATPLHLAAPNGNATIVRRLLAAGADVNARDALGSTALLDAAFVSQPTTNGGQLFSCGDASTQGGVVAALIAASADIQALNREGQSALFGAVRNGFEDVVDMLLDAGAAARGRNRQRETLLHVAARAAIPSIELWRRLLETGVDPLAEDRLERTAYDLWMSRPKIEEPDDEDDEENHQDHAADTRQGRDDHARQRRARRRRERQERERAHDTITLLLAQAMTTRRT